MFSSISAGGRSASGSPSSTARAMRAASETLSAASDAPRPASGCPSQIRISTVGKARCGRTLHQSCVCSVIEPGLVEEADVALDSLPVAVRVGDAAAREQPREDLRPRGVEAGVDALDERRARRQRRAAPGSKLRSASWTATARSAPADPDVDVEAEGVVPPDDVAQELVVPAVVRRVDDPLLLPVGPRMRARRAEREPERLDELAQLRAPLDHRARHVRERLAATRLDLHLGRDQLADEVLARAASRRRPPAPPRSG